MKQEGFKPIGQTDATVMRQNQSADGNSVGKTAVAALQDATRVAAWLAKQRPVDMDKAAVSRASSHGVGLKVRYEWRYPSGPNGEYLPSYAIAVGCDVSDGGNHAAAAADLRNFLTPAPIREIEAWLAELSVIVARRQDDAFADELRVSVYSSRLSRFPADVVRSVLTEATYKFWPTWEELEKRCRALTGPRLQMIAALEKGPPQAEPTRREPTQDERDRIQAMVDEMFPTQTPEDRKKAVDIALAGNCMADIPQGSA